VLLSAALAGVAAAGGAALSAACGCAGVAGGTVAIAPAPLAAIIVGAAAAGAAGAASAAGAGGVSAAGAPAATIGASAAGAAVGASAAGAAVTAVPCRIVESWAAPPAAAAVGAAASCIAAGAGAAAGLLLGHWLTYLGRNGGVFVEPYPITGEVYRISGQLEGDVPDTADADHDGRRARDGEMREPPHRVVRGQAGVRVRRDGRRLDSRGQPHLGFALRPGQL